MKLSGLLPPVPARLLLLGDLQQKMVTELGRFGYEVAALPLIQPQDFAQVPSPTRQGIFQVDLPFKREDAGSFAGAIVFGLTPAVHPLALWDQLALWLADDAVVVLAVKNRETVARRMPNWLDYVVAIGARCGFVEEPADRGTAQKDEGGCTLVLRKTKGIRWQVRHVRERDFDGIAALFQEVFGHTLSRDLWNWKYAHGKGNAAVAARHGAVIAHYGGMYRDVMLCGKLDWVFQICDVMVHPQERGVMTRNGPFQLMAATIAEIYGPLGFGFPNDRHAQLAEKVGVGKSMGQMAQVRWSPTPGRVRFRTRVRAMVPDGADNQLVVESLWLAMAHDLQQGVVGLRDWAYLKQRYFSHPHNHYDMLLVTARLSGKALGVVVVHRLETSCELMDVVAPLANLPQLIDQARRLTGMWGLQSMYCWISSNHVQRFLECGGAQEELHISIPNSAWTNDPRAGIFKDKWWLMSGDTDFR